MRATRLTLGAISLRISSHFPISGKSMNVKPVMFPPGRARLATKPCPTGSLTTEKTIGMVWVARFRAAMTGPAGSDNEVRCRTHHFRRISLDLGEVPAGKPMLNLNVAILRPSERPKSLPKRCDADLYFRIVLRE
jgi:hypothetical protein